MKKFYNILDLYPVSDRAGYFTLILGAIEESQTKNMRLFGEFELKLLSAKEFGLIDGVDDNFISNYKSEEIFFGEISEQNLNAICKGLGINDTQVIGCYIIEI